jgi:lipopolysaccharide transport system permease protein
MSLDGTPLIRIRAKDPGFIETVGELLVTRELLLVLVVRQIKMRYAQTAFGTFWIVIQPLLSAVLYTLVFGLFVKVPTAGVPYVLFSYSGMVVWTVFSQGFDRAGISLVQDERLITKTYFPRLHLPISAALSVAPDLAISTALLLPVAWILGFPPQLRLLWALPAIAVPLLLATGAGSLVASLNIRWRDLRQAAPFLVQIFVWATPVAYPLEVVPGKWRDVLLFGNPMTAPVLVFRHAVVGTPLPSLSAIWVSLGSSLLLLLFGTMVFRSVEKTFADYI